MLPNLLIIGAMKCATTSLHYYLDRHPEIAMSSQKELDFFIDKLNWKRGLDWYQSWFRSNARIRGEASPKYTSFPLFRGVAKRMYETLPDARLIYMVRDPLDRIISNYRFDIADGYQSLPLATLLEDLEDNPYVVRSQYNRQVREFLRFYPLEQILIMSQESLRSEREKSLERVFRFLGVDPEFRCAEFELRLLQTDLKRVHRTMSPFRVGTPIARVLERLATTRAARLFPMGTRQSLNRILTRPFSDPVPNAEFTDADRSRLVDILADDANRFRALTGQPFSEWSI